MQNLSARWLLNDKYSGLVIFRDCGFLFVWIMKGDHVSANFLVKLILI